MFLQQAETAGSISYGISTFIVSDARKNLQIPVLRTQISLKKKNLSKHKAMLHYLHMIFFSLKES